MSRPEGPKRVAIVAPWGERAGGAEELLWTILCELDPSLVTPAVTFLAGGPFVDEVAALGLDATVVPAGRLRQAHRIAGAVAGLTARFRGADVVLSWSAKAHLYAASAARLGAPDARTLWWQHDIPAGQWLNRVATRLPADAIICCSTAAAQAQRSLRPRRRIEVVRPGVDVPSGLPPREALRTRLGIPDERVVVGIAGRLQPWKGQHHVIEAVADLARRGHDVHALVVGGVAFGLSPEYEPYLHRLASQEGLDDRVTFTGRVDGAISLIGAMDVCVNASAPEPFGLVILEAMAVAVPTVAYAAGGPLDIVLDGETGVLAPPPFTSLALADAIEPLLVDAALRKRMGLAARRRALEAFPREAAARSLEHILEQVGARR